MKNRASLAVCLLIGLVMIGFRSYYSPSGGGRKELVITRWDAFGYYLYLPATFIYHDYDKLAWASAADSTYSVTGGSGMPVVHLDNGNQVSKYFCGVALLQTPLFAAAHLVAKAAGYPADGFSPPYQYALSYGAILYCFLALLLLRRILRRWFDDPVVALCLLLLCLATNFIQYTAVDNGLSHAWIFPLYVILLWITIRWHERPTAWKAVLIGYVVGLATICRPTEAIALFIPLLWNTHDKAMARDKWALVRSNRSHIILAILGGFAGILPQLLYWKAVTGSYVFDVGSKWVFLNPWWRVLVGWEKGWFVYTPVTLLFVAGFFFLKKYAFRWSVLVFLLLNIWIVIAWDEWQYGASYAARALMQSYPVFALPFAALLQRGYRKRVWMLLMPLALVLVGINLFQTWQYNEGILHYNDMNRRYYGRIFLNPSPSALDVSLMDNPDFLNDESGYRITTTNLVTTPLSVNFPARQSSVIGTAAVDVKGGDWLRVDAVINAPGKLWQTRLDASLSSSDSTRTVSVRLFNPVTERTGNCAFYIAVPDRFSRSVLQVRLRSDYDFSGSVAQLKMSILRADKPSGTPR